MSLALYFVFKDIFLTYDGFLFLSAFLSYVRSYASYPIQLRPILPFKELHLGHIAKSLCLRDTPQALGAGAYLRPQKYHESNKLSRHQHDKPGMKQTNLAYKMSAVDTV